MLQKAVLAVQPLHCAAFQSSALPAVVSIALPRCAVVSIALPAIVSVALQRLLCGAALAVLGCSLHLACG